MMTNYEPPFHVTDRITVLVGEISERVGAITVLSEKTSNPRLRRENLIRTIHSSLAIEGNSLSLAQTTAILDGKRVLGTAQEIREVRNAGLAYELLMEADPFSVDDVLRVHHKMMNGLVTESGRFRSGGVGVFSGNVVVHTAPPADLVLQHISGLLRWYQESNLHPLIKSAIFHYEFEFIHPFADGNGRVGRLWHSLLLGQWKELFFWLPVEELIQTRQQDYYRAFVVAGKEGDSSNFVEFMLEIIRDSLAEVDVLG